MKNVLLVLLIMGFVSLYSQKKQVKSITEIKYNKNDEPVHKIVEEFNIDSILIKNSYYNSDFKLTSYRTFTPILNQESTEISYNENNEIDELDTIRYNPDNEIIYYSRQHFREGETSFHIDEYDFDYDISCNILIEYRIEDGHNGWVYYYDYNDQHQLIKRYSEYDKEASEEYTYKYEKGNLVELKLYDFNNEELKKQDNTYWFYKYKKGRKVSEKIYSVADYLDHEILNYNTFSYSKVGLLNEVIMFEDGEYNGKKIFHTPFISKVKNSEFNRSKNI